MAFFQSTSSEPVVYDYEGDTGGFLDEDNDAFNDETFGDVSVGKDFDFAGNTARVAGTLDEEQAVHERTQHGQQSQRLQPLAELWAQPQSVQQPYPPMVPGMHGHPGMPPPGQGRPLTVQELEQQMIQNMHIGSVPPGQSAPQGMPYPQGMPQNPWFLPQGMPMPPQGMPPQGMPPQGMPPQGMPPQGMPGQFGQPIPVPPGQEPQVEQQGPSTEVEAGHGDKPQARKVVPLSQTMQSQLAQTNAVKEKQHARDKARAEQARFNGLMGEWDKSFILKIQLQNLISQDPYNEDFYYQVHTAIRARENPREPLGHFAKTYAIINRRNNRNRNGPRDPLVQLQQQVQEAAERVAERAKNRANKEKENPTSKTALGQGKSSSAAHPRTALSLPETNLERRKDVNALYDAEYILRACEECYDAILELEAHDRARPPPDQPGAAEWAAQVPVLQDKLWDALEVQSPLDAKSNQPFLMMIAHPKGKKLIPRAFPHLEMTRRLTILTRIFHQIGDVDVIRNGVYPETDTDLPARSRKAIDLFLNTALPPLVHFIGELELNVVIGLAEMLLRSSCGIATVARTRVGQALLTVLISRAELINQENTNQAEMQHWRSTFEQIFLQLKPHLAQLFPPRHVENSYVWHFLASLALAATLEHQRLLVDAVRDRIFGTMAEAKSLPLDVGAAKIANLNLFLNVMGLNATFDDITELSG